MDSVSYNKVNLKSETGRFGLIVRVGGDGCTSRTAIRHVLCHSSTDILSFQGVQCQQRFAPLTSWSQAARQQAPPSPPQTPPRRAHRGSTRGKRPPAPRWDEGAPQLPERAAAHAGPIQKHAVRQPQAYPAMDQPVKNPPAHSPSQHTETGLNLYGPLAMFLEIVQCIIRFDVVGAGGSFACR